MPPKQVAAPRLRLVSLPVSAGLVSRVARRQLSRPGPPCLAGPGHSVSPESACQPEGPTSAAVRDRLASQLGPSVTRIIESGVIMMISRACGQCPESQYSGWKFAPRLEAQVSPESAQALLQPGRAVPRVALSQVPQLEHLSLASWEVVYNIFKCSIAVRVCSGCIAKRGMVLCDSKLI